MNKTLITLLLLTFVFQGSLFSQTEEELMAEKARLEKQAADIQSKIDEQTAELSSQLAEVKSALEANAGNLEALPGWNYAFLGTLGGNVAQFNNWFSAAQSHAQTSSVGVTLNGLAEYDNNNFLWKNNALLTLGGQRILEDTRVDNDNVVWQKIPDQFLFSSLAGYKIMPTLAVTAEAAYRTAVLSNFNNPGDLDLGTGVTWTPVPEFYLLVHPLNYHWKFGDNPDFNNALGAKIKAGYNKEIFKGVKYVSQLEGFYSYQELDPAAHWWEWNNGVSFTVWKGIGVGINFAFRGADSEILNTLQSRWNMGLSYTL